MRGITVQENALVKETPLDSRSRPTHEGRARGNRASRRKVKTDSFVGERDTLRVRTRSEDSWMCKHPQTSEPTGRPQDDQTSQGRSGKSTSKSPTEVIPSIEIRSLESDPKRVTPSWRNTDQLSKEKLCFDRVGGKPHSTHRVTPSRSKQSIDGRKKPSFRSSEQ